MKKIVQVLFSFLVFILGYECMVEAFHLLNQPSDRAVYAGMAIIVLLVVLAPASLFRLWRE